MQSIRNSFIAKIKQAATDAVGTSTVLQLGIGSHLQMAQNYPNATIHVGAGAPSTPGVRAVKFAPTHQQTQTKLQNNRDIIFELFLTEIIQHWFDFLAEIYAKAIGDNLHQSGTFPIPKVKLQVDLSCTGSSLLSNLESTANADFDFLPSSDKLRTVKKIINLDISTAQADETRIRINIQIRNILQHQLGIVSNKDLSDLGVAFIEEDHGNLTKQIKAGDKITRTAFDIENLVDSLINVATALIH